MKKDTRKLPSKRIWILIIIALIPFFLFQNKHLVITNYTYESDKLSPDLDGYRIVQISDLHNATFGKNNRKLLDAIKSCSPDMIVLAHEPQYLQEYADAGADLVLSGHAHGGQFRLPFIGGLVAPDQGFLPKYTSGDYTIADTDMIVSRGLGNSIIPVRLFNYPEIVCVELKASSKKPTSP